MGKGAIIGLVILAIVGVIGMSLMSSYNGLVSQQEAVARGEANGELTGALSRLLVVVENYPNLKSDKTFIGLMDELSGTENRIAVARRDYNETVQSYNTKLRTFPTSIIAGMFNFTQKEYFRAEEAAKQVPAVKF